MLGKIIIIFIGVLFSLALAIFINPSLVLNPHNLEFALDKSGVLKNWNWKEAKMEHQWVKWNERLFSGEFKDFCFTYENEGMDVESCLEEFSYNFKLKGTQIISLAPVKILAQKSSVRAKEQKQKTPSSTAAPDVQKYWRMLWQIPDLKIALEEIEVQRQGQNHKLEFFLTKIGNELNAHALSFDLRATPEGFALSGPDRYKLPLEQMDLYLNEAKLTGQMQAQAMPLQFTGNLQGVEMNVTTGLPLPMSPSYKKNLLESLKGRFVFQPVKGKLQKHGPDSFNILPAPLNAMDGSLIIDLMTYKTEDPQKLELNFNTNIDMHGNQQDLVMDILTKLPLNIQSMKPGAVVVDLDFKKVRLQLPRIANTVRLPQFRPDPRFKMPKKNEKKKEGAPLALDLEAKNSEALQLRSNLLDEPLRLNFDMQVVEGKKAGKVRILPLETTVFKRPVQIPAMNFYFNDPKEPVLRGQIIFPLPEYKITMNIEGPMSQPRYAFESDPPLPQNDIYSVLLFGRPLQELGPDDKNAATRTNQLLAQGVLSLSVLYFLAGSPVEYVGFDPESGQATAQIGLGRRSALRVSGGEESRSTGIRHSLGKGWYLDTSAERTPASTEEQRNYGVMLERIIAY